MNTNCCLYLAKNLLIKLFGILGILVISLLLLPVFAAMQTADSTISRNVKDDGSNLSGAKVSLTDGQNTSFLSGADSAYSSFTPPGLNGKIAFESDRTGNSEIFTMNPDGSNQTNISNNPANDSFPAWSPDGKKIAFQRDTNNGTSIYTMNADGSNQIRLTGGSTPHWSPDGTKIVYGAGDLYLINADGTNLTRLTTDPRYEANPQFSPGGSQIAFTCSRPFSGTPPGNNDEICVINADGSNERKLTDNPYSDVAPTWSPDGSKIAFMTEGGGGSWGIWTMNADGSNKKGLVIGNKPEWSPDGTKIAYGAVPPGANNPQIFVMNSDGTNKTRITANSAFDQFPAWQRILRATAPFDFDGDGRSDQAVFRPSDRVWYLLRSSSGFTATQFGISTDRIVPADYDGDGITDIAVNRGGLWYWLNSSNGSFSFYNFGGAGTIPVPADYTGDGRSELAIYYLGTWHTLNTLNNQSEQVQFGIASDKPVPADYDGDGKTDFAVYRDGTWHYRRSSDSGHRTVQWGIASDKPVVGDYDGDLKADQAVFRNGVWYVLASTQGWFAVQFGISSDIPVPADYDGDGKTDIAVYRDGTWYWRRSSDNGFRAVQWGTANDKPIPSAFVP
jgi:Tol biopolymer transport system component